MPGIHQHALWWRAIAAAPSSLHLFSFVHVIHERSFSVCKSLFAKHPTIQFPFYFPDPLSGFFNIQKRYWLFLWCSKWDWRKERTIQMDFKYLWEMPSPTHSYSNSRNVFICCYIARSINHSMSYRFKEGQSVWNSSC